jgi:hypothetical protein
MGADEPWDLSPETTAALQEDIDALSRGKHLPFPAELPVEQLLPRVRPLVYQAIDKFQEHGIPLFRRVTAARELAWPVDVAHRS